MQYELKSDLESVEGMVDVAGAVARIAPGAVGTAGEFATSLLLTRTLGARNVVHDAGGKHDELGSVPGGGKRIVTQRAFEVVAVAFEAKRMHSQAPGSASQSIFADKRHQGVRRRGRRGCRFARHRSGVEGGWPSSPIDV